MWLAVLTELAAAPVSAPAPEEQTGYTFREDVMNMHGGGWCVYSPKGKFIIMKQQRGSAERIVSQLNNNKQLCEAG